RARLPPPCPCPGGSLSAPGPGGGRRARSNGSGAPPSDELELDVVGVAEHEHRTVRRVDDRRVRHAVTVEGRLPHLQLGPARDAERPVVEPGAGLVERRAVAPDRLPAPHPNIEAVVPHAAPTELRLVDAFRDLEAQDVRVETFAAIAVGDRQVDVRDRGKIRHSRIQPPTGFSNRVCVYSPTVTSPTAE